MNSTPNWTRENGRGAESHRAILTTADGRVEAFVGEIAFGAYAILAEGIDGAFAGREAEPDEVFQGTLAEAKEAAWTMALEMAGAA